MKKIIHFCIIFSSIISAGQVVYSDQFDSTINNTAYPNSYSTSLNNGNLRIVGNGTATQYAAIEYKLHNAGTLTTANISTSNRLFIKAKATVPASLRIDLKDAGGYNTNLNPAAVNLTTTYQIFEVNYIGKYQDGGYGGPCLPASAPCSVNPAQIRDILFFVNAGTGMYNGTIDIDWISLGASLEAPPAHTVLYNQVGYFKNRSKLLNILAPNTFSPVTYNVYDSANNVVLSGTTPSSAYWSDAQQYATTFDVSAIITPGTYKVKTSEMEVFISINDNPYTALADASFKYYYYNRASTAITAQHGGAWARASGTPDTNVRIHSSAASSNRPTNTVISAPKGWYDAGDYNKYVVNAGISTYTLLAAFEHYGAYYGSKNFNIPESTNNLPDVLDEVIWNLDWMLAMQDKTAAAGGNGDGGVYHKLTGLNFSGIIMPENYNLQRYVVQKTTAAALNFAAVTAIASRVFANYPTQKPGYSAQLLQASKDAYAWAKARPAVYYSQPSNVSTGEYGDNNVTDEFQWAAIELFITTNLTQYKNDININTINANTPSWQSVGALGLLSIAHHTAAIGTQLNTAQANGKLTTQANIIKNTINTSPMRIGMTSNDFVWGSNGGAGNQLVILLKAYELTNDATYLDAAYKGMDYMLGRNGNNKCYVTGFGVNSVMSPHHRISEADNVTLPVPGMVAGGPHPSHFNDCTSTSYPNLNRATSYHDGWCSYSTNEVTINWNAPLMYAVNALSYYQTQFLSVDSIDDTLKAGVKIYPNPVKDTLTIALVHTTHTDYRVRIYDLEGKQLIDKNGSQTMNQLDISYLSKGIYIAEITVGSAIFTEKIVKE